MNKNIFQSFKIVALALTLSVGISYVSAWTAPTATPPGGNTVAPLNTGGTAQIKTGNLTAWTLTGNSVNTNTLTGNSVNTNTLRVAGGAAASKVLTSDAAGNATWQPASAGNTYTAGNGLTLTGNQFSTNTTQTQARVTGTCSVGSSISAISSTGTVTCSNNTYAAGNGLTLTGNIFSTNNTLTQARVSGTCGVGSSIRAIDAAGAVTCETDDVGVANTYAAGNGLTLTGNQFSTNNTLTQARVSGTCAIGSSIRVINADGTVSCEVDDTGNASWVNINNVPTGAVAAGCNPSDGIAECWGGASVTINNCGSTLMKSNCPAGTTRMGHISSTLNDSGVGAGCFISGSFSCIKN